MVLLKEAREKVGVSQVKLAEMAGVSPRMIPKYETGEKSISRAQAITVYKIAVALGVTVEDLIK